MQNVLFYNLQTVSVKIFCILINKNQIILFKQYNFTVYSYIHISHNITLVMVHICFMINVVKLVNHFKLTDMGLKYFYFLPHDKKKNL